MSTLSSASSLRTSRSSSTFPGQLIDHSPILLTRRASSDDATALLRSASVTEALSKTAPLSSSSSAQSSLSFVTSVSSSSFVSASSPKPTAKPTETATEATEATEAPEAAQSAELAASAASTEGSRTSYSTAPKNIQTKSNEDAIDQGPELSTPPLLRKTGATPPPSLRRTSSSAESRTPSSAGSGIAPLTSEHSQPQSPLFFGDYLFPENPSLRDLRQMFLLDKSSKQKDFRQSLQLHAHLMGLALSARVSRGLDLAYDHAHDAFKNRQRPDRRNEFISTFNYTHDETERILHHALAHPQPRPSFLDMMSPTSSTAILTFLHRLRTDHSILATAFRNLQSQELDALLLPERPPLVLPSQFRGTRDRGYNMQTGSSGNLVQQPSASQQPPAQQRQLQQSQGAVPNYVNNQDVVHIILSSLFGPSSFEREHALRTGALTSIFVTLLSDKKGERLMTEILERYVVQSEWQQGSKVKAIFEKTLLDILHRGESDLAGFSDEELNANVLPYTQQHHQSLGRMSSVPVMKASVIDCTISGQVQHGVGNREPLSSPVSIDSRVTQPELTARQVMVEEFYTEACLDILDTLGQFSPPCLMELSRRVFAELDQNAKPYASLIIIVKFFFYRFMNKCIAYPETYGMVQDIFVSEKQRQRILFTTHQRLYRYVTGILNPVPGWESRSSVVDPRIREKIENFVSLFSSSTEVKSEGHTPQYTLNPISESSTPAPVSAKTPHHLRTSGTRGRTAITPVLLLCPSDFTSLFYFVCPYLKTATAPSSSSATLMTRSNSFNGKSAIVTRQRTTSETPPTYPTTMKSASSSLAVGATSTAPPTTKLSHPPSAMRTHKRASPSFSFFSGAASSLPFKAKPPPPHPHLPLEKVPSAPAESTLSGVTFLSLSGIRPGQVISPKTAAVEVTSTSGIAAASCVIPTGARDHGNSPTKGATSSSSLASHQSTDVPPVIKHWSDEALLPDLKAAIGELKRVQPGPIKEVPWAVSNPNLTPLREPWALAYVQCDEEQHGELASVSSGRSGQGGSKDILCEVGLALAPPCMAMVMENSAIGGGSRIVTVTKPMLVDQVMDSAGSQGNFESSIDLDLEVEESDNDSLLSSEDASLAQRPQTLTAKDKEMSILRVNSSQMLSSIDESGTIEIPACDGQSNADDSQSRPHMESHRSSSFKRAAADRAWKTRIRQTVQSEADLPEEIRTVARSIFKILREFDVLKVDEHEEDHHWHQHHTGNDRLLSSSDISHNSIHSLLQQGIEQAHYFGNHAAAIGFHHSLRVLESSPVLRQLDSSKIIYLLAMPIKHRLEHRAGRARSRTLWEGFAHSWHMRLVSAIERKRENLSSLRIKMYYQTCVRSSRAFEKSLGVIVALSRLNRAALRKYLSADEWERCNGGYPSWSESDTKSGQGRNPGCDSPGCKGSCLDQLQPCQTVYGGESTVGHHVETASRRYSANSGPHAPFLRASKVRRSSFSTYIDNMTSRSFGSSSFLESSLGHLKEKEQASFSSSYTSSGLQGGMLWSGNNSSQPGSIGSLNEAGDLQSDFTMDARETEAVQRWITDTGIHNFLPGEDNFLRFCMEVESVVRGVGLGGTGIQGAGITQAHNGAMFSALSSSGSDFFVKEVAKFNGQFVAGMGPFEQVVQAKSGGGVAEFLVNSFKNGHSASSVPTTTGGYFFSQAGASGSSSSSANNSAHNTLNNNGNGASFQSAQAPMHNSGSVGGGGLGGRTRILHRQAIHNNHQGALQDAIPVLQDDPSSIYSSPTGPTYALYNPPYSVNSHGNSSSSYSGSSMALGGGGGGGASSTMSPHQIVQLPKDMNEFLRRIQLKLTSFLLSEWLEIFGEVEADRWFLEFLDEMGSSESNRCTDDVREQDNATVSSDVNQDGYFVPLNQMEQHDSCHVEQKPRYSSTTTTTLADLANSELPCSNSASRTSLHRVADSGPLGSAGNSSWQSPSAPKGSWIEEQPEILSIKPSASVSTFSTARSIRNIPSLSSLLSGAAATADNQQQDHRPLSSQTSLNLNHFPAASQRSAAEVLSTPEKPMNSSGKSLLNFQFKKPSEYRELTSALGSSSVQPYDLGEAYRSTIEQFNCAKSPYQKLGHLFALELLIVASLSYPDSCAEALHGDRRPSSARSSGSRTHDVNHDGPQSPRAFTPGTDAIVNEIENLFRRRTGPLALRPRHLLRDMQLIATFIPGSILDLRDDGKAFWDMALAISSLKSEVIEHIVRKGNQFVEVEESSRTSGGNQSQDTDIDRNGDGRGFPQDDEEERARMAEAVRLFTIGAKESHPVAQRELAILYMSLPMLPSSSSPPMGYSPQIGQVSRVPSPVSITSARYGKAPSGVPGRTSTPPPPPSPKGTFSSAFLGKPSNNNNISSTASIPIKQKARHQHSSSGSGSSFGSGVLNGLGIMTGLGSFTGGSSVGSGSAGSAEAPNNSSTASLTQQQYPQQQGHRQHGEFAEGHHDVEKYLDMHQGRHSGGNGAPHPQHGHGHRQQQQHQQHHQQQYQASIVSGPPNSSGPDKFNPENVAAAMHWFTLAAAQGDKFSINYLKHKETAGGILGSHG